MSKAKIGGICAVILLVALVMAVWKTSSRDGNTSAPSEASTRNSRQANPPSLSPPRSQSDYEKSTDLLKLVDDTAGSTDANKLGVRARALDECRILALSPNYFDGIDSSGEQLYGKNLPKIREYVAAYRSRCLPLVRSHKTTAADVKDAILQAALAGNHWASAKLFATESREMSVEDADVRLHNFLASRDGDAIGALADAMAMPKPDSSFADLRGSQLHVYAWQLAACDLGADCSSSGELMRNACLFGGMCASATNYRAFLSTSVLSPEDLARVETYESSITRAARTGGN